MRHVIHCGNTLLVEGEETRVFAIADPDDSKRIKAIPIPTDLRVMCE
jgi:4-hydroxybenzoyl-CoA thioesterase